MNLKRMDIVKINSPRDIYDQKIGALVSIKKSCPYPYRVCFGEDYFGNGKMGLYNADELVKIK